jgi:acetyl esterase/lipase
MRIFNVVALALVVMLLTGCSKFEAIQEKALDVTKQQTLWSIKYGSHTRNVLDIALPANRTTNTPVIVFIHGGAWIMGDKGVFLQEIDKFSKAGFACATINYRYASDITNVHNPDLPNDVKAAIDFIVSKSAVWNVSPDRFGLVGQSAGGHLSLLTAYTLNDGRIKACASWAGLLNLIDPDQLAITGAPLLFKTYVGSSLNTYADTLHYQQASPYWMANSSSVPTLMIQGTEDIGVPYSNAVRMHQHLDSLGVDNQLTTFNGAGHLWAGSNLDNARNITLQWFLLKL